MTNPPIILRIALPTPLRRCFDYLPPQQSQLETPLPGVRVRVPFGKRQLIGVLVAVTDESDVPHQRLKQAQAILDQHPLLPRDIMEMLHWSSAYYHHPLGDVIAHALPALLRQGHATRVQGIKRWILTEAGQKIGPEQLRRAPRQAALLQHLQTIPAGLSADALDAAHHAWRSVMARVVSKGWVEVREQSCLPTPPNATTEAPQLSQEQQNAVQAVTANLSTYQSFLLDGVTGSGKTEVYLQLIEKILAAGRQALVLVPEIGLTPQLSQHFRERLPVTIAVLHSGLSDTERLCAWLAARSGKARVILGTRSAVFTPLAAPGLIIIDEEHDLSFKQQDGFRYSARDLSIWRARQAGIPVLLGSATPSLESLSNCNQQRTQRLRLTQRAGGAIAPKLRILDVRHQKMRANLSAPLLQTMHEHLGAEGQVLLFLNRRGFAPTLLCHDCGWLARCERCDSHLTYHRRDRRLRCHHCGAERPLYAYCPACGSEELRSLGYGTERIEQNLQEAFTEHTVLRIDRDSTRRKGAMSALLNAVHTGHGQILLGTQMLAKGHHFPNVTLVGILDADYGLYSADFRAAERMAQLIIQVAGRAGRAERPGEVLIQTHHPENPLLQTLIRDGYHAFAAALLQERQATALPPYTYLALLRAEAVDATAPLQFLQQARQLAEQQSAATVSLFGPMPSPMERRAGRFRAQLLLQANQRAPLQNLLTVWITQLEAIKSARNVRWSLDVDPQEMF